MKFTIDALLARSAAAFSPSQVRKDSMSLNDFESKLGYQDPLGLFDTLGMLEDADQEPFYFFLYVKIKHGSIAQLAFLGHITTRNDIHMLGNIDYSCDSLLYFPNGWADIYGPDVTPQEGLLKMVSFIGFLKFFVMKESVNGADSGDFVGDFYNGYIDFGWENFDEDTKVSKHAIDLKWLFFNDGHPWPYGPREAWWICSYC